MRRGKGCIAALNKSRKRRSPHIPLEDGVPNSNWGTKSSSAFLQDQEEDEGYITMKVDNYTFLTQMPVPRVVATMSVSTIFTMLVTSVYNIADTYFVGFISTQATAAVGIVFSVMFVLQAIGFFFGHGSGNFISRELGAKRHEQASRMAITGVAYSFAAGLLVAVTGLVFMSPLSVMLGSTPTILPSTKQYMGIVLLGAPFLTSSLTLNNQLRFQGNAAHAMLAVVAGAVLNIILDPIFIFVFEMGVAGAATATVIGQLCSWLVLLAMTRHEGNLRLRWKHFTPSARFAREIVAGGTPSLMRQGLGSVATILMNVAAAGYGDAAIAAMSIVNRFTMLIMAAIIGLGQGYQPLCGFCYGARLYGRVKSGMWFCVRVGTVFLVACSIVGFGFTRQIIDTFRSDPHVVEIGATALRWQLLTLPLMATYMYANMMLQTIGMTWRANLLAASRQGLFFIPMILLLPFLFGLKGVELCPAVCDVCAFILTIPVLRGALVRMH